MVLCAWEVPNACMLSRRLCVASGRSEQQTLRTYARSVYLSNSDEIAPEKPKEHVDATEERAPIHFANPFAVVMY